MTLIHDPASKLPRRQRSGSMVDSVLVGLAGLHAVVLLVWPSAWTIGLGLWWNANTISHNFIHRPFFRAAAANATFSLGLSMLLGLPQSVWRDRHLAHHAGISLRIRRTQQLWLEVVAVVALWAMILLSSPWFFVVGWLPGIALGLTMCAVHGYFEHVAGGTTSHYGRVYNCLFLNDGYHVEHHAHPACGWRRLPAYRRDDSAGSKWPAVLRWLEHPLETLEHLVLRWPGLQEFVLDTHRLAWERLAPDLHGVRRVGIIGGGLFPRTALLLRDLLPDARLSIIDGDPGNLELARLRLGDSVAYDASWFSPQQHGGFDLLVFPLDYRGDDLESLRRALPAPRVVFHEWLWRPRGNTVPVPWLLKRLNLLHAS